MLNEKEILSNFRYERKFNIKGLFTKDVISIIKRNPSLFKYTFHKRQINNIYFDDLNFNCYKANVDGLSDRVKIRIRWYGDTFKKIEKPILEIKIKKGLLGKKESLKLKSFHIYDDLTKILMQLKKSTLYNKYKLGTLSPVMLNSYTRSYYISSSKNFRITIDDDLKYYKIKNKNNLFKDKYIDKETRILEIKYNSYLNESVNTITNRFPFRMTKNSKYVNGIENIYS